MEYFTIDLGDKTALNVSFEYDPGESGSYDEPPSVPAITIMSIELCQFDGKEHHTIELYGIDDTLFPVDHDMIERIITEKIQL